MYANEFKTKEKQKLTELKKLTATYTTVHLISAWVITSPPPTQVLDQVKWSPSLKAEGDWEKTRTQWLVFKEGSKLFQSLIAR